MQTETPTIADFAKFAVIAKTENGWTLPKHDDEFYRGYQTRPYALACMPLCGECKVVSTGSKQFHAAFAKTFQKINSLKA